MIREDTAFSPLPARVKWDGVQLQIDMAVTNDEIDGVIKRLLHFKEKMATSSKPRLIIMNCEAPRL